MQRPTPNPTPDAAGHLIQEAAGAGVRLAKSVRKRWSLVVALTLLATGLSLVYVKVATPVYEAQSLVEINPHVVQPVGDEKSAGALDLGASFYWDTREYYETQYKIIGSDRLLGAVARELGLPNDQEYIGHPRSGWTPLESAIAVLRKAVTVEAVKDSMLVQVKVDDTNAARARRICDSVVKTYIDQNLQRAIDTSADAVVWLSGQLDHIKGDLEKNENELHDFKERNQLPSTSINEASNMFRVELQEYDMALTHTRTRMQELLARKSELLTVDADHPDVLPASELLGSGFLQSLRGQYVEARRQREGLLAEGKAENHPLVKEADQHAAITKAALLAEVHNIEASVERDLQIVEKEQAGEQALFDESRKRAVDLNLKEIEYHRLDRMRDENEKLYSLLLGRMKDEDLARMLNVNNVRVIDRASDPKAPVRPRATVDVLVGLAFGLVLGVAVAWARDVLDSSVKTPDDVEQQLAITFLGLLPEYVREEVKGRKGRVRRPKRPRPGTTPELIVHDEPLSGIAEAARTIRTNLMFISPDHPCRVMLVSSAAPSEGKTTVACSIAVAFAQGGQRVCLVDCDLRRPRMHRIFDHSGASGLTNVLVGEAPLDEVIKDTPVPNLSVVCAGPLPPNPADMLHSERFKIFLRDLAERFDRVVIDSPPLVAVTDGAIISRLVDGTLFVVRAFNTSRQLSNQGLRALRDVDAPIVGAVLNAVKLGRPEYAYYYHSQYYGKGRSYAQQGTTNGGSDDRPADAPN